MASHAAGKLRHRSVQWPMLALLGRGTAPRPRHGVACAGEQPGGRPTCSSYSWRAAQRWGRPRGRGSRGRTAVGYRGSGSTHGGRAPPPRPAPAPGVEVWRLGMAGAAGAWRWQAQALWAVLPATERGSDGARRQVPGTCPREVVVDCSDAQAARHALHEHVGDVALRGSAAACRRGAVGDAAAGRKGPASRRRCGRRCCTEHNARSCAQACAPQVARK